MNNEDNAPRVKYFINTEYMSVVLSELLLTIEVLFKAELVRSGLNKSEVWKVTKGRHQLTGLMDKMMQTSDERCRNIAKSFDGCRSELKHTDENSAFVNARYIDWDEYQLDDASAMMIKKVTKVLDNVYEEYYYDFDIEHFLYLGMIASFGECDFSDEEKRRLRQVGLLEQ